MELCEERQLLMRLLLLLRPPVLLPLRPPVLQVLVPVDRATVKVMEMGRASAREETTGMATMGTGTALATAAEMDTEIA